MLKKSYVMLKLCTLSNQVNLFLLQTNYFLAVVVIFVTLHVLAPEIMGALQKLINIFFFVNQVKSQLILVLRSLGRPKPTLVVRTQTLNAQR